MPGTAERTPACKLQDLIEGRVLLCNVSFGDSPHLYGTFVVYNVYFRGIEHKVDSPPRTNSFGVEWVYGSLEADSGARLAHATARLKSQERIVVVASSTRSIPVEYLEGLVREGAARSRLDR